MGYRREPRHCLLLLLLLFHSTTTTTYAANPSTTFASDAEALLTIKATMDGSNNALAWGPRGGSVCSWSGVRECTRDGRVRKLVVEYANLTGELPVDPLSRLDQVRVLSLKSNAITGSIPDLSALANLKILYLSDNRLSGVIPASFSSLHRLKVVVLSGNRLTGGIPPSLGDLPRLYALLLQDNALTGEVPAFRQMGLTYLNLSNNDLTGEVPNTLALSRFNESSFLGNPGLCGERIARPCASLSATALPPPSSTTAESSSNKNRKRRVVAIVAGSVSSLVFVVACVALVACLVMGSQRERRKGVGEGGGQRQEKGRGDEERGGPSTGGGGNNNNNSNSNNNNNNNNSNNRGVGGVVAKGVGGFSWEGEGLGRLVFLGGAGEMYSLEELLKASAETLGRGSVGSTYKAVMESGFIVTVKRLRDNGSPGVEEFGRRVELLGGLRHPNLVPLRAYFQAKEERLLVYDYFPNGSLFSLIHGPRASGGGKPLHWTSCLKIAEDVATGLLFLHQTPGGVIHGNLKSSNVLLGSDFESCLTDYGLVPSLRAPDSTENLTGNSSLFYRAPESRNLRKAFTPQSDIYSFGVLLLELLTGKTPFQDLVEQHGADVPQWVRSVREEETESGDEPTSGNEGAEEKLGALLNVAIACIEQVPESRPATKDVLRMIRDARAEVLVSSNSSEHSPARWSDTVQSLPREYGSEHLNFAERD